MQDLHSGEKVSVQFESEAEHVLGRLGEVHGDQESHSLCFFSWWVENTGALELLSMTWSQVRDDFRHIRRQLENIGNGDSSGGLIPYFVDESKPIS
jgi:hypothetical protein